MVWLSFLEPDDPAKRKTRECVTASNPVTRTASKLDVHFTQDDVEINDEAASHYILYSERLWLVLYRYRLSSSTGQILAW